jgi:hypothetical protein
MVCAILLTFILQSAYFPATQRKGYYQELSSFLIAELPGATIFGLMYGNPDGI